MSKGNIQKHKIIIKKPCQMATFKDIENYNKKQPCHMATFKEVENNG